MKKFFSLVLALVMALSLTTVAWGADTITSDDELASLAANGEYTVSSTIVVDGEFELSNVTINTGSTEDAFKIVSGGKLTLGEGVTITGANSLFWVDGGELIIDGATVTQTAGTNNMILVSGQPGVVTVEDGVVSSATMSAIVINTGSYTSLTPGGTVNIKGGTVSTDAAGVVSAVWGFYGTINVSGGSVINTNSANTSTSSVAASGATATVSGGYLTGVDMAAGSGGTITVTGGTFEKAPKAAYITGSTVTDVNGNTIVVPAAAVVPASGAKGAYYTTDMATLAVYPACDLTTYKYTLENYANGSSVAKLFDQKAIWATHKVTGAKVLVDTAVVASADSANLAFVNGSQITYLNTNVTAWGVSVSVVPTVEYDDVAKCGEIYTGGDVALYTDANGKLYLEGGATAGNVKGNYVALTEVPKAKQFYVELDDVETAAGVAMAGEVVTVKHTYAADTKTVAGETEVTNVVCTECKKSFAFVEGTDAMAIAKFGAGNYINLGNGLYVAVSVGAVDTTPAGTAGATVESAETFDAGIAMYVGMSVMAAAGSAVVLKKKD